MGASVSDIIEHYVTMAGHIVSSFADELHELSEQLAEMGRLATTMIDDSYRAISNTDTRLADAVIQRDQKIDDLEALVRSRVASILALRGPLAGDLRAVMAAAKISRDIERVGDLAKSISKRVAALQAAREASMLGGAKRMARAAAEQMQLVLRAYMLEDPAMANSVIDADDELDAMYNGYLRETLTYMMSDRDTINAGVHVLFVAKNLELIGDHTTNIAATVQNMLLAGPISQTAG